MTSMNPYNYKSVQYELKAVGELLEAYLPAVQALGDIEFLGVNAFDHMTDADQISDDFLEHIHTASMTYKRAQMLFSGSQNALTYDSLAEVSVMLHQTRYELAEAKESFDVYANAYSQWNLNSLWDSPQIFKTELPKIESITQMGTHVLENSTHNLYATLNFELGDFLVEYESYQEQDPYAYSDAVSDWQNHKTKIKDLMAQHSDASAKEKIQLVIDSVYDLSLNYYYKNEQSLMKALDGLGGNCDARTRLVLASLIAADIVLPEGEQWGVEVFSDHVQPVIYNKNTNTVFNLLENTSYAASDPIYHPLILVQGALSKIEQQTGLSQNNISASRLHLGGALSQSDGQQDHQAWIHYPNGNRKYNPLTPPEFAFAINPYASNSQALMQEAQGLNACLTYDQTQYKDYYANRSLGEMMVSVVEFPLASEVDEKEFSKMAFEACAFAYFYPESTIPYLVLYDLYRVESDYTNRLYAEQAARVALITAYDQNEQPEVLADFELNLAKVLADMGRHQDAIVHLQTTIELVPAHFEAYHMLILIYEVNGQRQKAKSLGCEYAKATGKTDLLEELSCVE